MHASAAFALAVASFAAAQSSTSSAATGSASTTSLSGCGTQIDTIIASCLGTIQPQLTACPTNDWDCMCTQQTNVLTCYNNCMSDPNRAGAVAQQTSWCNAAHPFGTTSSTAGSMTRTASSSSMAASGSSDSSSSGSSDSMATATSSDGSMSSETGSASASGASASQSTGAAVANVVPGAFAAIFGLVALL